MKTTKRIVTLFSAIVILVSGFAFLGSVAENSSALQPAAYAQEEENAAPAISVSCEKLSVTVRKKVQMTAQVSNVSEQPRIVWESSDENIATVDQNGLVKGVKAGRAIITATAVVDGEVLQDGYAIKVVTKSNFIKSFLVDNQVLSYKYSYVDDYYYTNDKYCWQSNLGFSRLYDIFAPYFLMEYDYNRVFFEYQGKEFMIQLWKGQYGMVFYGGEIGIYHRKLNDKENNAFTFYKCADEEFWPQIEMTLYRENLEGEYIKEFTRDYDKYWWCTGFKDGHLRDVEPADELRITARMTLIDAEMTSLFVQGLIDCGFEQVESKEEIGLDQFYTDGTDVYLTWQNISEAENTMPVKTLGFLFGANILGIFLFILMLMGMGGLIFFII